MTLKTIAITALALALGAGTANAKEIRVGLWQFDSELGGSSGKETSSQLSVDYIGQRIDNLDWLWSPHAYIGGAVNLEGNTNHAGFGLLWRGNFQPKWYAAYGLGFSAHDGEDELPKPAAGDTAAEIAAKQKALAENIEFGSQILFRNELTLGYQLNDINAIELGWEHLSNGTIFGDTNEGVDNFGVRYARKFD